MREPNETTEMWRDVRVERQNARHRRAELAAQERLRVQDFCRKNRIQMREHSQWHWSFRRDDSHIYVSYWPSTAKCYVASSQEDMYVRHGFTNVEKLLDILEKNLCRSS